MSGFLIRDMKAALLTPTLSQKLLILLSALALSGPMWAIDRDRRLDQLVHTSWTAN